ncbi:MAG TPA: hypothetical protein VE621_08185 [Bryobacteraceae bacterium]|jgi:hypothetical protein|nr:hypothetical protein [Bryobacteraceae bacterium]
MLTIRADQQEAFKRKCADVRNKDLAHYARARFPGRFDTCTPEEMANFCGSVRRLAADRGVTEEPDVATVLDLVVMYGIRFYEADWAKDVFAVPDWSGTEKMRVIRTRVRRQVAEF